jgi:hypothetical protein
MNYDFNKIKELKHKDKVIFTYNGNEYRAGKAEGVCTHTVAAAHATDDFQTFHRGALRTALGLA